MSYNIRFTGKRATCFFNEIEQRSVKINVSSLYVVRVFIHANVHGVIYSDHEISPSSILCTRLSIPRGTLQPGIIIF